MNEPDRTTAVKVYEDRRHAHIAVEELTKAGFTHEQVGYIIPESRPVIDPPHFHHPHTKKEEGAAAGAASGGAIGGLLGAAMASAVIPGIGPVIAGGILTGVVAGMVAGVAGGGLLGALIGMSIPEQEARDVESEFHSGRTVVTVHAGDRFDEAMTILEQAELAPETTDLHPGARPARLSDMEGPGPGSSSIIVGE